MSGFELDFVEMVEADRLRLVGKAYAHDLALVQAMNRLADLRTAAPADILRRALSELRAGSAHAFDTYVDDPTSIMVIVSSDDDIEAVFGRYLPQAERQRAVARDLGWLAHRIQTFLPCYAHDECRARRGVVTLTPPQSPWLAVGVARVSGGSVVLLSRLERRVN